MTNPSPLQVLSSRTEQVNLLILKRLQAKGQQATPKIIRRFVERELGLATNSLDEHRKTLNKMIKKVITNSALASSPAASDAPELSTCSAPAMLPRKRSPSPPRKNSPYYNVLRRLCFTVKINCNRLGLGGKAQAEKLNIIKMALKEKGFNEEQLNISNVEETLEMAEVERDRRELEENTPELENRTRRRSTETYKEFFAVSAQVSDAISSSSSSPSDSDADDEESEFSVDECSESDDDSEYDIPEEVAKPTKPKKKRKTTTKSKARKKKTTTKSKKKKAEPKKKKKPKKQAVESSEDEMVKDEVTDRKRKRSLVSYAEESGDSSSSASSAAPMKRRRSAVSDDESFEEDSE